MICAEVSIYPLKTDHASGIIAGSISKLDNRNIDYTVGSISTHLQGSEEQIWNSLRQMFHHAGNSGEVSMVVTISNAGG